MLICQQHRDREVWKLLYSKVTVPFAHLRGESNWGTATLQGIPLLLTSILESSHVYSIHVFSTGIQFQNCTDSELAWNSSSFFFKKPLVRQQSLDGSSPKACRSCTCVHGNQRGWLAKLLRHQFGNGCSLCNGAGLCSAPGEALSKPSRCCKRINECCFSFILSCLHSLPLHPSVGSPNFWIRSFSIFLACLVMSLFAIILSVYCRPLSPLVMCW